MLEKQLKKYIKNYEKYDIYELDDYNVVLIEKKEKIYIVHYLYFTDKNNIREMNSWFVDEHAHKKICSVLNTLKFMYNKNNDLKVKRK